MRIKKIIFQGNSFALGLGLKQRLKATLQNKYLSARVAHFCLVSLPSLHHYDMRQKAIYFFCFVCFSLLEWLLNNSTVT